jgi:NADPH:quinone reductase
VRCFSWRVRGLGETLLVDGASGGVGLAAVQLARAAGMRIIGTAGTDEGLQLVKNEGTDQVVNHRSPDYQKQIVAFSNGAGVDVILEMLANINLAHDLKLLAYHGRVVVVGSSGNVEINPRDMMTRETAVFGVFLWMVRSAEASEIQAALQAGLGNGTLCPVIAAELPLNSATEAHRRVMEPGARGKIVLIPWRKRCIGASGINCPVPLQE